MFGLVAGLFILVMLGCILSIKKDLSIPKCLTCKEARAKEAATCLHCGAH